MNIKELFEGVEPELPGAPEGIQIMTPQQFIAKSAQGEEPEPEQEVAESKMAELDMDLDDPELSDREFEKIYGMSRREARETFSQTNTWDFPDVRDPNKKLHEQGVAKGFPHDVDHMPGKTIKHQDTNCTTCHGRKSMYKLGSKLFADNKQGAEKVKCPTCKGTGDKPGVVENTANDISKMFNNYDPAYASLQRVALLAMQGRQQEASGRLHSVIKDASPKVQQKIIDAVNNIKPVTINGKIADSGALDKSKPHQDWISNTFIPWVHSLLGKQGVAEGEDHLSRIRKLSGLDEATKLPAPNREFGSDEFQNYMKRIIGTPDIDKKTGEVKKQKDRISKKGEVVPGKEKYISGKTKSDKYKMPYIHRNSAVQYIGPDGKKFSEEKIISALSQRPKSLLKQNEKMRHSNGEQEQFFNIGFAALTGIAVDEQTGKLIIVNTCPGAGSCKVDCFVIHQGGKIQFEGPWLNDGRILTYLLNDPDGFFEQLSSEISKEERLGKKGGYNVTIRWHDSGDFFSPEYLDMALKMATKHPDIKFYAYTKMAGAALGQKPPNFIINWSEGAHTSQEKQVKAQDPTLSSTKNSRIVPEEIFQDLLAKDETKKLVKGEQGQWQLSPGKLPELKERLAQKYNLSTNSILSYDEYMAKRNKIPTGMKYNVIVMGGEGDVSANDPGVLSTLLLKH